MMRSMVAAFTLGIFLLLGAFGALAAEERKFTPEALRADFDELYVRLQASHFNLFARQTRGEYQTFYREMRAGLDRPLSAAEAQIRFQKFMAFGHIAHANIAFPSPAYEAYRDAGGKVMPLAIRVVNGAVRVTENDSGVDGVRAGEEIVALNGQPMAAWLARLLANTSADNAYMANTMLEWSFTRLLWLELGPVASFDLTVRHADGATEKVVVPARTRAEIKAAAEAGPKTLDLDWDKREARMLRGGVAYLRPGPFYNNEPGATNEWDMASFAKFIDGSFESFLRANAKVLVIDLRNNPGGDNSFSDLMVRWYATKAFKFNSEFKIKVSTAAIASNQKRIDAAPNDPDVISRKLAAAYSGHAMGDVVFFDTPMTEPRAGARFTGRVFVLINRHSYSNCVQVVAMSQDYKFATIVGEETSDLATTYGAMEQFTLPRTGIAVGFPKALIIRANGDLTPRGVVPDIAIETPVVEPASDPVLARAVAIAAGR